MLTCVYSSSKDRAMATSRKRPATAVSAGPSRPGESRKHGLATAKSAGTRRTHRQAESNPDDEKRRCKLCDKRFTRQGLGGHMSRAHPGQSEDYKRKKETRRNREDNLNMLRLAQTVYRMRTGQKSIRGTDMNRTKLNKIREEIKMFYKNNPDKEFPINM